jgi:hypothetical protein
MLCCMPCRSSTSLACSREQRIVLATLAAFTVDSGDDENGVQVDTSGTLLLPVLGCCFRGQCSRDGRLPTPLCALATVCDGVEVGHSIVKTHEQNYSVLGVAKDQPGVGYLPPLPL